MNGFCYQRVDRKHFVARTLLQAKLLPEDESGRKLESIVDLCARGNRLDVLIVPLACLNGKLKGKGLQLRIAVN